MRTLGSRAGTGRTSQVRGSLETHLSPGHHPSQPATPAALVPVKAQSATACRGWQTVGNRRRAPLSSTGEEGNGVGKGSGKRATRKRVADVSAVARDDAAGLTPAAARRLSKLEKDLAAARKTEERQRSRLAAASAEADRIRLDITELIRHAAESAARGPLGAAADAAGSPVAPPADEAVAAPTRSSVKAKPSAAPKPAKPADATPAGPAKPPTPRPRRARPASRPTTGPDNG